MWSLMKICGALSICCLQTAGAIKIDLKSPESIKRAAGTLAFDMMTYYQGNLTGFKPGVLPPPYYWWQSGAMWGSLINYWVFTGDSTYNDVVKQGLLYQVGENDDYMPKEHRSSLGNDDQGFWAVAVLSAAESNFPDPAPGEPSWLGLAQAVFNEQIARWDTTTCNGGIRWQIYVKNGYDLKNTISNGLLFQIAARLARYTGEQVYQDWAVKVWDWMWAIGLIDNTSYNVYDNSEADKLNCTELERNQWSYNAGVLLGGASTMYNITDGDPVWKNRTQKLLTRIEEFFFSAGPMTEICERVDKCNPDQKSFKAYLSRWMTLTSQLAPFTHAQVHRILAPSILAANAQCNGGVTGTRCGIKWYLNDTSHVLVEDEMGVGQQMSALEITISALVALDVPGKAGGSGSGGSGIKPPVTSNSGGTSPSVPDAGKNYNDTSTPLYVDLSKTKDKVGAWFITAILVLAVITGTWFLYSDLMEYSVAPVRKRRVVSATVLEKEVMSSGGSGSESGGAPSGRLDTIGEVEMTPAETAVVKPVVT